MTDSRARVLNEIREREHLIELEDLKDRARKGLLNFTKYTKPDYHIGWHHRALCKKLNAFARGDIKRLMVFMPPRHGKSELVSRRLPAFLLGLNPKKSIISASYSADLASMMNRDVQRIIDSDAYRDLFPDTYLEGTNIRTVASGKWLRNSDLFEVVGHGGMYRSTGVGGGITGMGAHTIIIDDPIKNQEEADSPVYRQKLWEWYTSTLYTRLEKDGQILLTVTRWHEDDLAGKLLAAAEANPEADQWEVVKFPAMKEDDTNSDDPRKIGEPLWPEKYSFKRLRALAASVGERVWQALYQQSPTSPTGQIIKRKWIKFYKHLPDRPFDKAAQSWDCAFKDTKASDFVNGDVWHKYGAGFYLADNVHEKMDMPTTVQAIRMMTVKHPKVFRKLIEDKANGPAVIQTLQNEIAGIVPITPKSSKESRGNAAATFWEAGNVYLPDPSIAPWIVKYIEEIVGFPSAKNDDRFDSMTQAILDLAGVKVGEFTEAHIQTNDERDRRDSITLDDEGGDQW